MRCNTLTWPTRQARGFTLLEILVVLAIIGAVSALAVVRLESSDARRVVQAAEQLATVLEAARDEAISTGNSVAVSSDGQGYQFWLADDERNAWLVFPAHEMLQAQRLGDGVIWRSQQVNGHARPVGERLIFLPDGTVEPFALVLSVGQASQRLEMDALGRTGVHDAPPL